MNHALNSLRESLVKMDLEALLVADPTDIAWLTGFSGSFGRAIVTQTEAILITDSRYTLQANEQALGFDVRSFASPTTGDEFLAMQIQSIRLASLGFDSFKTVYQAYMRMCELLPDTHLVPTESMISALRMIKSSSEIEKIRRACALADSCFEHVIRLIQPGVRELDISLEIEFYFRKQGAELAFSPIVLSGDRSARPHGKPSDRELSVGDFVVIDFGAKLDGYCSDISRTVVVGKATARHHEIYHQVLKAQVAALQALRAGDPAKEVDLLARQILDEKQMASYFGHGLGHGLGIDVHDGGRLAATSQDTIEVGQVWTVEPGVYIPDFGGVRIEDDVVITESGIEILTHSTKELLELPLVSA